MHEFKKLANWIWRDTSGLVRRTPILMNFHIFYLYIIKMVPFVLVIGTICLQTETYELFFYLFLGVALNMIIHQINYDEIYY